MSRALRRAQERAEKKQKKAAKDKKFSCQTRLLGLEANLIMNMKFNFKKNDVKSIIEDIKKFC